MKPQLEELELLVALVNKEHVSIADCFHDNYDAMKYICKVLDRERFAKDLISLCSALKRCDPSDVPSFIKAHSLIRDFCMHYASLIRRVAKLDPFEMDVIKTNRDFKILGRDD